MSNDITRYTPSLPAAGGNGGGDHPKAPLPALYSTDPITAFFDRMQAKRDAKTLAAFEKRNLAGAALIASKAALTDAEYEYNDSRFRLAEQPEKLNNELAVRRLERLDRFQTAHHVAHVNAMRRETEKVQTQSVLEDARCYLKATKEYNYKIHALAKEKQLHDIVDLELDKAHKKKLLEDIRKTKRPSDEATPVSNKELANLLLGYRAELEASGRDSRVVEKALAELQEK